MTSGENQPIRPILSTIRRACPECGGAMTAELLRPDPNDYPALFLICPCGYCVSAPADIEADAENRPRMPGF